MWSGQRRVTRGFVAAAGVALAIPALTVAWLGWLLLRSDRELDRQRVQERLDATAGLIVASLERGLAAADQQLVSVGGAIASARQGAVASFRLEPGDGTVVVFEGESAWSSRPLPWYPGEGGMLDDPSAFDFIDAEALEFRGDLAGAAAAYRALSRSPDPAVRAGALAREARVANKRGQPAVALTAYDALSTMPDVTALGRPADLLARVERLAVLREPGDDARASAEARAIDEALLAGRWRLTRSQFEFYRSRVKDVGRAETAGPTVQDGVPARSGGSRPAEGRAGSPLRLRSGQASPASTNLAIAEAVSSAAETVATAAPTTPGARLGWANAHGRGLVVWRRVGDRVAALVTTQAWLERTWLADVRAIALARRARVSLAAADGHEWLDGALAGPTVRRSAADTGLPVTLRVASADLAGDTSTFAGRRRLLAGIVAALALLMMGAGYVAARGLAREVAAARLQSDFVAAVSHEFRTPVASVRQLSELLEEGRIVDDAKRIEYYGRIRRQAGRLQRLVENLLDFGRMEAGAAEYRMDAVDAASLVRDVTEEFRGDGRGSGRTVDVVIGEPLPALRADREALGRALWNLLDNAAKYSPADAPIVVEATGEPGGVVISVRDRGAGISREEQSRIFDRFVRGAHARESGAKGTGLGLAMVRHIARAHGGDVTVESEPGRGSTFTVRLASVGTPLRGVHVAAPAPRPDREHSEVP